MIKRHSTLHIFNEEVNHIITKSVLNLLIGSWGGHNYHVGVNCNIT